MISNPYLPIVGFSNASADYLGGLSKIWLVPREWIASFPELDPTTQLLVSEPTLIGGKNWIGPIAVANELIAYEEVSSLSAAGNFYKRKVSFSENGLSAANHLNITNMMGYECCVVGLVRSGAFFIVLGNDKAGLKLDVNSSTGNGPLGMPMTKLVLSDESADKAFVLGSFDH